MVKKTKPKPKPQKYSFIARMIDQIANRLAIPWSAVANYPGELEAAGLEAEDVTPHAVQEAYEYHLSEMRRIADRAYAAGLLVLRH